MHQPLKSTIMRRVFGRDLRRQSCDRLCDVGAAETRGEEQLHQVRRVRSSLPARFISSLRCEVPDVLGQVGRTCLGELCSSYLGGVDSRCIFHEVLYRDGEGSDVAVVLQDLICTYELGDGGLISVEWDFRRDCGPERILLISWRDYEQIVYVDGK